MLGLGLKFGYRFFPVPEALELVALGVVPTTPVTVTKVFGVGILKGDLGHGVPLKFI
ncbi:unnamed protein product [Pararhodospirillum photometricum DSM 122]|uniref:Uncharacterized protein n=1 Tax=Pararhodospirillum photometricum DSM 122 TaxID=1150469 RepID=H6SM18_PARPM|nr:unnamed protein product [Pararhodospirillum photometricum DSM 122]